MKLGLLASGISLSCLLTTCYTLPATAQAVPAPLSLAAAWQQATAHNHQVRGQRQQVAIDQELTQDRQAALLPRVQAAGQYAYLHNLVLFEPRQGLANGEVVPVPPSPHAFNVHLGADWDVYTGGRLQSQVKAQQLTAALETERLRLTEAEVRLRVAVAYLELGRAMQQRHLAESSITEAEKQQRQIQALLRGGVVLRSDLLRADLQLSQRRLLLTEVSNNAVLANQRLNLLMGTPEDQPNVPEALALAADIPPVLAEAAALQQAEAQAPELRMAALDVQRSAARREVVAAAKRPQAALFAEYGYTYPNRLVFPNVAQVYGLGLVGVRAAYNISAFYTDKHADNAAQLAVERQQTAAEEALDDKRLEVKTASVRYQESQERIRIAEQSIGQATENQRIISRTYFNQLALLTDLLDADNQLLQARFDLVTAQAQAATYYYQLQKALGRL